MPFFRRKPTVACPHDARARRHQGWFMSARQLLSRLRDGARTGSPPVPAPILDVEGVCPVCDQDTRFQAWDPWLRDSFICVRCHSVPRERAFYTVLERVRPDWRDLDVHESSPRTPRASWRGSCSNYTASPVRPGAAIGAWARAGATRTSNSDLPDEARRGRHPGRLRASFEPDRAIAEIARTLRPGGLHIGTAPLANAWAAQRAAGAPPRGRRRRAPR
jgi:hypothetical protein